MAIKFLRGLYRLTDLRNTRPAGFRFPIGLKIDSPTDSANGSSTVTQGTFDVLLVAGGGGGGARQPLVAPVGSAEGGGGGGGGIRILSSNAFTELCSYKNPTFISSTTNFIPVIVGGDSCFSQLKACRGGYGGPGGSGTPFYLAPTSVPGGYGGSGGGGGGPRRIPGNGIPGQGFPGGPDGQGGSALSAVAGSGLTTSFTGESISFSNGATRGSGQPGQANRGNGGRGGSTPSPQGGGMPGGAGGSGLVAIRYRNPAAPTMPLATGGDTICCTGGCIIHVYCTSGLFNVESNFSLN
jgi:hypothetical protein